MAPSALSRTVLIALGSNLGDSVRLMGQAMDRLQTLSDRPILRSSLWKTAPVDCPPGSPPFINAAVALQAHPGETPEGLLARLQAIEREFGRLPKKSPNAPRPLDLDLIAFGEERRSVSECTVPHPRAHLRQFVLGPLSEIVPNFILPGQSATVAELAKCQAGGAAKA
jgi:2-amino-4-hydroxy-6-hydroxymethyldihydropteridine diphosphokinase